ncbi:fused isobutyryl-CoA mutase/GTPase IcmF [Inmirania thermothiophila]|uniref:Fused isobutyryl-CoA mutase n=1 Tax=Inmirania thermothiophila TaxID=1750597 RepID=A0A3N1Y8S5_9GAMM|nr:fused isobutyryl-CoA mutase/GTPase IcmF [Inmirania thermothiophila]ROR35209.1 methylmalonyl-CoA mutase [Inmirania thermothiophila]
MAETSTRAGRDEAADGAPRLRHKIRFVTAASLFDGHDASINIIRRLLQSSGAEVVHLGHNRAAGEIVRAAIQEDVQGIAVSSYQGGHMEFFKYMVDLLREQGAGQIRVFGGGGGVIVPAEIRELQAYGVERVYSPEDGVALGLKGMIEDMLRRADFAPWETPPERIEALAEGDFRALARVISMLENDTMPAELWRRVEGMAAGSRTPVLGITGTGGAGKSSLTDEIVRRFRADRDDIAIAIIAVDPSRRRTGGALLGDRIRMNAIDGPRIYMRSLATRDSGSEIAACVPRVIEACKAAGFDLVILETSGIGQGDAAVVPLVDLSLYVMTPEFGAASQLEKIDMLDFADLVAINKFDRRGADDALRDVRKQVQRNREAFDRSPEEMPVYGTVAARFNDPGVTALYHGILDLLRERGFGPWESRLERPEGKVSPPGQAIVPPERERYLAEIAETVRGYRRHVERQARIARELQQLRHTRELLAERGAAVEAVDALIAEREAGQDPRARKLIEIWPKVRESYAGDEYVVRIRDREVRTSLRHTTLAGTRVPKVALPKWEDHGELTRWLMLENVPGSFPYTAGVFAFKREGEEPTRMFAGEGDPFRTNRRFHYLSRHSEAKRLSTAFDSVTLYGFDPDERPDIYGKIGNAGVSVATLDDMKALYEGFDLCHPLTSVSMTINGPAPAILAMFFNTAIDQQLEKFERDNGRPPTDEEIEKIRAWVLSTIRGTVQADILKEDQGQNTCIFSTEFALRMMADVQEWFVQHDVRNFYSVSISGYHIAEAGANPITQLAFTLANGFTYVEAYLARGMHIDEFAPNLSFFFSNGMDAEYSVIGRVARRIWAIAMRERYGANERSQKLKYHVQTSGRSLHAMEMEFNDIRTTLQALIAIYDNCNSLHTNAYDEAYTTPTEASVRRALAIQQIINKEWGLAKNENPNQGSFIIEELTDLVEEAVLAEFERLSERGGVLGAMERGYQRGKIQEESLHYETLKHDGTLPIVGVNTFLDPDAPPAEERTLELRRSTEEEKQSQLRRLRAFHERHREEAGPMLERLKEAARRGENTFAVLMDAVRCCSLGQITRALFEVGGQYRRNM